MSEQITTDSGLTIGLDLGDRFTEGRVLDATGEVVEAFRVRTTEPALSSRMASFPRSRVGERKRLEARARQTGGACRTTWRRVIAAVLSR